MRFGLTAFILALALASGAGTAMAQSLSYECDLSGNVPHGGGMAGCNPYNPNPAVGTNVAVNPVTTDSTLTTGSLFWGARSDAGTNAIVPIYPISQTTSCYWVDNSSNNSIFVPFKSPGEWISFTSLANSGGISGIHLVPCTPPGSGSTTAFGPPYPGSSTQTSPTPPPNVYGRADSTKPAPNSNSSSVYPTTPVPPVLTGWTSNGGATTITALAQWYGGCGMSVCGAALNTNWVPTFVFSPNLTLTAQDTTLGTAAGTSITATTGDTIQLVYKGSDTYGTISGVTTGGTFTPKSGPSTNLSPWTPSGTTSGSNISGTGSIALPATPGTYTYTLTTADSNGLTSTATVTISTSNPAQCGTDSGGVFSTGAPTNLCAAGTASPSALTAGSALTNADGFRGWSWTCTTADNSQSNCNALQTAPQCGSVTINPDSTITNGPLCIVGTPTVTPTYSSQSYACTTTYGTATATTAICGTVAYIPPTVTDGLTASAAFIASGSTSQLNWSETNATGCSINGNSLSLSGVNSGTMTTPTLTSTTSYTLSCTDGGAPVTSVATVNVCPTGTSPNADGTACVANTCNWQCTGAYPCTGYFDPGSCAYANNGQVENYTNGSGEETAFTCECGASPPTVTLTATPASITSGSSSTLTWTVSGTATSCTASGGSFTGSVSTTSGSTQVVNPTSTTTYSLSCSNAGGTSSPSSTTVTVNSCGGYSSGGYCYYSALSVGTSCDTFCASHGSCNEAGTEHIGSQGSDAACTAVAVGIFSTGYPYINSSYFLGDLTMGDTDGAGCIWSINGMTGKIYFNRATNTSTSCSGALGGYARICACNN